MQDTRTYRVLIVDDNEAIHRDFRSLLQSKLTSGDLAELALEIFGDEPDAKAWPDLPRYAFDSAYQGTDALETVKEARRTGQSYAMAFVDVRMPPGWDGVETIQRIWEVDPDIQMIICSAYADYSWDEIVKELGVTDKLLLLRKPLSRQRQADGAGGGAAVEPGTPAAGAPVVELEALVGKHGQELDRMRVELDRLVSEREETRRANQAVARVRAERATHMRSALVDVIAALERVAATALPEVQMAAVAAALASSRALLEIARELTPR